MWACQWVTRSSEAMSDWAMISLVFSLSTPMTSAKASGARSSVFFMIIAALSQRKGHNISPTAEKFPARWGMITRCIPIASASSTPWVGPAPPYTNSGSARISSPCSSVCAEIAFTMRAWMISNTPAAAEPISVTRCAQISVSKAVSAAALSNISPPPSATFSLSLFNIRSASVIVGLVPPRP